MLIMIYGEDNFRVVQKVKQIREAFCEKFDLTGMNTQSFPHEGSNKYEIGDILQSVCSYTLLGTKRMVLIQDLIGTTKKTEQQVWIDGFSRMPDSTILVLWETTSVKTLEKKSLFIELIKLSEVHCYSYPVLVGSDLNKWILERIKEKNGSIDNKALCLLIECVGLGLWQMNNEIDKLIAFANGQKISEEMVKTLVHANFEGKIFELMDAVSKKQTFKAIQLLEEERWSGANDHFLLTMLGRQVRLLLAARSLLDENAHASKQELADAISVPTFVAQKALEQAKRFCFADLRKAHDLLFDYDFKLKSGRIKSDLAVDLVTNQLIGS